MFLEILKQQRKQIHYELFIDNNWQQLNSTVMTMQQSHFPLPVAVLNGENGFPKNASFTSVPFHGKRPYK